MGILKHSEIKHHQTKTKCIYNVWLLTCLYIGADTNICNQHKWRFDDGEQNLTPNFKFDVDRSAISSAKLGARWRPHLSSRDVWWRNRCGVWMGSADCVIKKSLLTQASEVSLLLYVHF